MIIVFSLLNQKIIYYLNYISTRLELIWDFLPEDLRNTDFRVFITDPGKSTFFSLDFYSHKGEKINFENAHLYYDIAINFKDFDFPAQKMMCKNYKDSSYSDCVERQVQNQILKVSYNSIKKISLS